MFKSIVATALISALTLATHAEDKPQLKAPVGLQLYSLRTQFQAEGPAKTLDRVKAMGFKHVELAGTYGMPPEKFKAMLDERGLEPVSGHFSWDRFKKDPEGVAKEAKALGLKYAGTAWVKGAGAFDEAYTREVATIFNKAGKVLADNGIKFYYHCHGYEFAPHGDGTLFDLLVKETDPQLVSYEMDILWVFFPGQDPAKLLAKHPDRFVFTHLKDLKKGVATGDPSGKTDVRNDVALGTGQINYPALIKAAETSAVKYHFIEDESPTVVDQIPVTLEYLKQFQK
ncbi:MAG: sugar phosphate isomerase/epimerase family protein [Phycisphaerae bacterium]|nr:sugar phosphate isomerase/epimerase [Tepidisphaeraceae bacterium]